MVGGGPLSQSLWDLLSHSLFVRLISFDPTLQGRCNI